MEIETSDRATVMDEVEDSAKGGSVFKFGPGVAYVQTYPKPWNMDPTLLLERHGWYIAATFPNWEDKEVAVFAFPLQ